MPGTLGQVFTFTGILRDGCEVDQGLDRSFEYKVWNVFRSTEESGCKQGWRVQKASPAWGTRMIKRG